MKQVWITAAGTVTPLGNDLEGLWKGLMAGQSSIKPVERFSVKNYHAGVASCIADLRSSMEMSFAHTLIAPLITPIDPVPTDALLITATTKGGIDNLEKLSRGIQANPRDTFLFSLTESVSERLGFSKKDMTISAACASSTVAIAQGASLIAAGCEDAVLAYSLDFVTEFVFPGSLPFRYYRHNHADLLIATATVCHWVKGERFCY